MMNKWLKILAIAMVAAALAVAGEPEQRKRPERGVEEQTITGPGALSRQGEYWVEELTGSVTAAPRVRVKSPGGNIDVRGAAQAGISYRIQKRVSADDADHARRLLSGYPLLVRRRGDEVELSIESVRGRDFQVNFSVTVPKGTTLAEVETRGGNISAYEIDRVLRAQTAGGNIDADGIGGEATVQTAGGNLTLKTMRGPVKAQTAGGNIKLGYAGGPAEVATAGGNIEVGKAEGSVRGQTAGGSITVTAAGGDVTVQTAGGNITIGDAARVDAQTAGGSIEVGAARALVRVQTAGGSIRLSKCAGPVRAETAAGTIVARIAATRGAWAASVLETNAGDIIVFLPDDLAVTIRALIEQASTRHTISSEFPLTLRPRAQAPGPRELRGEGAINGGGPLLELRTVSGNIEIKKNR